MKSKHGSTSGRWTRRAVLKTGFGVAAGTALMGAPFIITSKKGARLANAYGQTMPSSGMSGSSVTGPTLTPFKAELPIPPVKSPVPTLNPFPNTSSMQRYNQFPAQLYYNIVASQALHSFHPDLPLNYIWGFDGLFPGPTLTARYGTPIIVRFNNALPTGPAVGGFGDPNITVHLHNVHTGSESNGYPGNFYPPGNYHDNFYPMMFAGNDPREAMNTLFYHDHRVSFTSQNVYKGLTGFCLFYDALDSGDETDTNPSALRLPSGAYDIPLVLADKQFDSNGALYFDPTDLNGFVGNYFTVNGVVQPYLKVARRKYRFRILDGGPSRFYGLQMSDGRPFTLIATDGNLLPRPVTLNTFIMGVAERYDVILDFSNYQIGDQVVLENFLNQTTGRGPTGTLATPIPLLRFDVDSDAPDPSQVPATLRPLPIIDVAQAVTTRRFEFNNMAGAWVINGRFFDLNRVDALIQEGTSEIWELVNMGAMPGPGGWSHPIHIHEEEFRILDRGGAAIPPDEIGRKDVVKLMPGLGTARVFIQFRDFYGEYVFHCHNMVNEDHAMMGNMLIQS